MSGVRKKILSRVLAGLLSLPFQLAAAPMVSLKTFRFLMLVSMGGSVVGYHLTASPRPVTQPTVGMNPLLGDNPHVGTAQTTFFPVLTVDF